MGSNVNFKSTRSGVPLSTDIALVGLLSRVNQTMSFQMAFGDKSFVALRKITLEGPFSRLTLQVTLFLVLTCILKCVFKLPVS